MPCTIIEKNSKIVFKSESLNQVPRTSVSVWTKFPPPPDNHILHIKEQIQENKD